MDILRRDQIGLTVVENCMFRVSLTVGMGTPSSLADLVHKINSSQKELINAL